MKQSRKDPGPASELSSGGAGRVPLTLVQANRKWAHAHRGAEATGAGTRTRAHTLRVQACTHTCTQAQARTRTHTHTTATTAWQPSPAYLSIVKQPECS